MSDCEFGHWPDYADDTEDGAIADCDFSEARLDGCRFHGCDPRTLRLPPWPCFTILDPIRNAPLLATVEWPGDINSISLEVLAEQPPSTAAVTFYAPTYARRRKTTPEAIKPIIEKFDCIVY
jgi:hypothetical protein